MSLITLVMVISLWLGLTWLDLAWLAAGEYRARSCFVSLQPESVQYDYGREGCCIVPFEVKVLVINRIVSCHVVMVD